MPSPGSAVGLFASIWLALGTGALADLLPGQCALQWRAVAGAPGTNGAVASSIWWDPDGAGPVTPKIVVGGLFTEVGGVPANRIAMLDPNTWSWSALGTGMNGSVDALAVLPNGDLVAGGSFTTAGGVPANRIARWNGTTWSSLGSGMNGPVLALAALPSGLLVAGGSFTQADGAPVNRVASWDGTTWSAMGTGMTGFGAIAVHALCVLPNGDLVAGGTFTSAGGVAASNVARWSGAGWSAVGPGITGAGASGSTAVWALAALPGGGFVAGGSFVTAGGLAAVNIARWSGVTWSAMGAGLGSTVRCLSFLSNGALVAGWGAQGVLASNGVSSWNGSGWSALGSNMEPFGALILTMMTLPNGWLLAGGSFTTTQTGGQLNNLARWTGADWMSIGGAGPNGRVRAFCTLPNGDIAVLGDTTTAGGAPGNAITRWDGLGWAPIGGTGPGPTALAVSSTGVLFAGWTPQGSASSLVLSWNGTQWSGLGGQGDLFTHPSGQGTSLYALATLPNGVVVAGGDFSLASGVSASRIARWNGSSWSAMGAGFNSLVETLVTLPNGDLVAAGAFTASGTVAVNRIARWDGASWSALGSGMDAPVSALAALPNGHLIAGGSFLSAGGASARRIARWDGASWSPLGSGLGPPLLGGETVRALLALPDGDILAAGSFSLAGGTPANSIARWDGANWLTLGSGVSGTNPVSVQALAATRNHGVAVGGRFAIAGGMPSGNFASLDTTCPAVAAPAGTACAGGAGTIALEALTLPWTGSTLRTRGSGWSLPAIAAVVMGVGQTSVPLAPALPAGGACVLQVTPDHVDLLVPAAAVQQFSISLPDTPALAGIAFFQQWVPFQLDAQGAIAAVAASAPLRFVVGVF